MRFHLRIPSQRLDEIHKSAPHHELYKYFTAHPHILHFKVLNFPQHKGTYT